MAARSRQHRGAFTLIEMLIVMGIVAILATMTVASYVSVTRRNAREGGVETVMNLLRQAHMSAVDSGRGAVARIDAADRSVYGLSSKVEAAWHFEDVFSTGGNDFTSGARAMDAQLLDDTALAADGALGLCLEFDGSDDYVDAGTYPVYNMTQGLRFEAIVWPDGTDTLGVADKAAAGVDGYALWLVSEGTGPGQLQQYSVHARITIQDELDDTSYELILDSADVHIPAGTWSHVALEYDGFEARLLVGGRLVDLDSLLGEVSDENDPNPSTDRELDTASAPSLLEPAREAPLRIGVADVGGDQFFAGRIDEVRLLSVAGGERMRMPPRVPIVSTDDAIYFDAQGYLDLAYHSSDVYVIVGDPYQSAQLQNAPLAADGATITVGPDNPFPAGGGLLLIDEELIRYASANGPNLTVTDPTDGADRGGRGTGAAVHQQGSTVYFARVLRVTQTGLVERVMHDSDVWD